jgi:hypothetical protein
MTGNAAGEQHGSAIQSPRAGSSELESPRRWCRAAAGKLGGPVTLVATDVPAGTRVPAAAICAGLGRVPAWALGGPAGDRGRGRRGGRGRLSPSSWALPPGGFEVRAPHREAARGLARGAPRAAHTFTTHASTAAARNRDGRPWQGAPGVLRHQHSSAVAPNASTRGPFQCRHHAQRPLVALLDEGGSRPRLRCAWSRAPSIAAPEGISRPGVTVAATSTLGPAGTGPAPSCHRRSQQGVDDASHATRPSRCRDLLHTEEHHEEIPDRLCHLARSVRTRRPRPCTGRGDLVRLRRAAAEPVHHGRLWRGNGAALRTSTQRDPLPSGHSALGGRRQVHPDAGAARHA